MIARSLFLYKPELKIEKLFAVALIVNEFTVPTLDNTAWFSGTELRIIGFLS
jgi:hypothetical protein